MKGSVPDADTGYPRDVFVKAGVIQTDPDRPKKVLAKVQELFAALGDVMRIELYTPGGKWDRLLKAQFGHALVNTAGKPQISKRHGQFYDPVYVGAGATGIARTRIETFKPEKGDESEGPTAYVFEGAIGLVIMDYFDGKANVDNIFAVAIAHELGHNLGLAHTTSTADIMFVYANRYEDEQKAWMTGASNNKLRFTAAQVSQIRALLAKT